MKLRIYYGLGNSAFALGSYEEAVSFYRLATREAADRTYRRQQGLAFWGLGLACEKVGDWQGAREGYQQALLVLVPAGKDDLVAPIRSLFGRLLTNLGQYEEAEFQLRQGVEIARRLHDDRNTGVALANLAHLFTSRGDYAEAVCAANAGLRLIQGRGEHRAEGQTFHTLAAAYAAMQEPVAAEQAFQEGITLLQRSQNRTEMSRGHERYAHFLAQQGRLPEAYEQMRMAFLALK